jgi:uncharacterized membrane protein YedE/YeeE
MLLQVLPYLSDNAAIVIPIGGFTIGVVFGATVVLSKFCTMGAIADIINAQDYRRFRAWIFAAAVALAGTQSLVWAGALNLTETVHFQGRVNWLGALGGGLVFGFGMVLAGGCPSQNIVRAGGGDLRAAMVLLVVTVFAFVTMTGLLAPLRSLVEGWTALSLPGGIHPSLDGLAGMVLGGNGNALRLGIAATLVGLALLYCFGDAAFRRSWRHVLGGAGVGSCVVAGWVVTTLGQDPFAVMNQAPSSLSFVRPVADTVVYFTRFTGINSMSFGVAVVMGAVLGATMVALATGRFAIRGFAGQADTTRNLVGGAMMGLGGVLALGCSIGQGVTGVSTMAITSFIAFAAMSLGAVAGVKHLESRV